MTKFLFKIFLFAVGLIIIDRLIYHSLQYGRPIDYKSFIEAKKEYFKTDNNWEILLIGDSHIADAVDPRILTKGLGMAAFNLGIYSSSPFEWYYTVQAALKKAKQKPKIVIIGTNPIMFSRKVSPGQYTPLIITDFNSQLNLSLHSDESIQPSFFLKSIKEEYLFTSVFNKLIGKKYVPTREIEAISNGYLEVRNQIPGTDWNNFELEENLPINTKQVEYFNQTLSFLAKNKIKVIVVNPPMYFDSLDLKSLKTFNEFKSILSASALKYKIPIFNLDYSVLKSSLEQRDFLNTGHLNFFGAQKFSTALVKWMALNEY